MPITITPDMVGKRIGVFLSVETKATTKATEEQKKWMANVIERGGIAVIARGPEDIPDRWVFSDDIPTKFGVKKP